MFDITFTKEFDSLGIPAILVIAIMFFFTAYLSIHY